MWPDDTAFVGGTMSPPAPSGWQWGSWRVPGDQLALLIGAVCGGALVLALLAALIAWRCCILPRRHKSYCTRIAEELSVRQRTQMPVLPSHCAVFAAPKKGHWAYNSRLVSAPYPATQPPAPHWFYNDRVLCPANLERVDPGRCSSDPRGYMSRSVSCEHDQRHLSPTNRRRPLSQPIRFNPSDAASYGQRRLMPEISEFSAHPTVFASSSISFILTVLDDVSDQRAASSGLRTRSLPAWVRSRPRPLSTEDSLTELYAKVNFSKKRKNRMRNDEAAIIALSKSRSQFLHKDTDSLVDNEAVIVYNERTAL